MNDMKTMSWNDRFALIDKFNPTDAFICAAFNCTVGELAVARKLRAAGSLAPSTDTDTEQYAEEFNNPQSTPSDVGIGIQPMTSPTGQIFKITPTAPPEIPQPQETATKRSLVKVPKKRGRKGDKIIQALLNVTTTPVPVSDFIVEYDVSLAVLRQSKRFITALDAATAEKIGKVIVKQDKDTKVLMIWKENNA
jgi:hypothetical protein